MRDANEFSRQAMAMCASQDRPAPATPVPGDRLRKPASAVPHYNKRLWSSVPPAWTNVSDMPGH